MADKENVITRMSDFLKWFLPKVEAMPRNFKFLIGDRIVKLQMDLLENLIEAYYSREKNRPLQAANLQIEKLRHLLRISADMQWLSLKQFEFATRELNEIGGMVGGGCGTTKRRCAEARASASQMGRSKPVDGLWDEVVSFEHLWAAARAARRGKRFRDSAARFERELGPNLVLLRDELQSGAYQPGPYTTFLIHEPARRLISAAPYRDRVVHHALCRVLEPIFDRAFVFDSYANRKGKGTHAALDRATSFTRRFPYVLQGDIRLFFPSLDHGILLDRLRRRIADSRVLELCALILRNSNAQEPAEFYFPGDDLFTPHDKRRGLPIGNLTSQFWANVYLDPLDHFVKDDLGVKAYARYVDDFLIFADTKNELHEWRGAIAGRLATPQFRLLLHERKTKIYPVTEGIPFLGFRVWPTHRRLLPESVKRARRRLATLTDAATAGARVRAWIAHVEHGDTWGLRRHLLDTAPVLRSSASGPQAV